MITFSHKGGFQHTEKFLKYATNKELYIPILEKYAREGVAALSSATPKDSGLTAESWKYKITASKGLYSITWMNTNVVDGVPIAIILQYGHATRNGGYVQGIDYINPALKPIFDKLSNALWQEVKAL